MIRIAVDAMGGDNAPRAIIQGAVDALDEVRDLGALCLVGDEAQIRSELAETLNADDPRLEIVHAPQVVEMGEPAIVSLRQKRDSSITTAVNLAKQGRVQAIVSAGHTGASVATTLVKWRSLPGIDRPGIATVFPSLGGHFVLLDAGANVDCKPLNLVQFAIMGEVYAQYILGFTRPRIGVLSVGGEDAKGNELTKQTLKELSTLPHINFVGNVEGHDLFHGQVDVVVCDGFVGNVALKCCESLASALGEILKGLMQKTPVRMAGAMLSRNAFRELKKMSDPAEYGGAPLLGVDGVCIIAHGSSSPFAIRNAIRVALEFVRNSVNDRISARLQQVVSGSDTGNMQDSVPPSVGDSGEDSR